MRPTARTDLLGHLTAKGFARETLAEAGLVGLPKDGGGAYDRFRNRIMFPIRDGRGRAIAFGARAVAPGQEPKYLNSPETPLFDKGRTLYNLGPARAAAGEGRHAGRHRGLHGRDRARRGRASRTRSRRSAPRSPRPSSRRSGSSRPSRWWRSTATPPGSPRRSG